MEEFSIRAMKNLLGSQTEKRISKPGAIALGEEIEEKAERVAKKSIEIAEDKDRKTVRKEDVRDAVNSFKSYESSESLEL